MPGGGRVSKELAAQIKIQDRWLKARLDADRAQKNVAVCLAEARTLLVLKVLAQQHEAYCEAWAGMSAAAKRDADGVRKRLRRAFDEFSREVAKKQGSDALQRSAQIQFPSQCTPIPPDFPFADVIRQWPDTIVAASPATWTDVGLLRAFYLYCRLLAGQSYAIDEQTFHVLDHTEYAEFATEVSYLGVDEVHAHRAFQQACRWYGKQ
ncbi:hypothetical protein [Streptomyces sp. NPDC089919]|uniref:hypothetical protein n=1 Tax=Streptomyces sp. NPDC089919 TaxID=3155188 RepID=UPI00343DFB76